MEETTIADIKRMKQRVYGRNFYYRHKERIAEESKAHAKEKYKKEKEKKLKPKMCEVCNKAITSINFNKHLTSVKHQTNLTKQTSANQTSKQSDLSNNHLNN